MTMTLQMETNLPLRARTNAIHMTPHSRRRLTTKDAPHRQPGPPGRQTSYRMMRLPQGVGSRKAAQRCSGLSLQPIRSKLSR